MKTAKMLIASAAFLAAAAPALSQTDPDAKLKRCAAEAMDIHAPEHAKITTRFYVNAIPPTDNIFYLYRQGDHIEEGRISIAKGKSGPATLNIYISTVRTAGFYGMNSPRDASSSFNADKGDIYKLTQQTTVTLDGGEKYSDTVRVRAKNIFEEIKKCTKPEPKLG